MWITFIKKGVDTWPILWYSINMMNEECSKQHIANNKDTNPIKLWFEFIGYMIVFGIILLASLGIVFGAIEWLG